MSPPSLKRRANLLYRLRKKGIRCDTKQRLIMLSCFQNPTDYVQITKLCRDYAFNVQYIIK